MAFKTTGFSAAPRVSSFLQMRRPLALVGFMLSLSATFAYGIGVGRYDWPPLAQIRSLTHAVPQRAKHYFIDYHTARLDLFEHTGGTADIVMLGDSITEGGNWHELLPQYHVINRGISGDTSERIMSRLSEVIKRQPRMVFIMIGINDLLQDIPVALVEANIKHIAVALKAAGAIPVIQSTLPVHKNYLPHVNVQVRDLDIRLHGLADEITPPYLDVAASLAPDGFLEPHFTYDGIHLTADAYLLWNTLIVEQLHR
jgi:lysophospholipase L1-like esterase